jgi:twinkle protein
MSRSRSTTHLPCPCGTSSDAYVEYPDGGFCFSCGKVFKNKEETDYELIDDGSVTFQTIDGWRGIKKATFEKFGVSFKINGAGVPVEVGYPYPTSTGNEAVKIRRLDEKAFYSKGDMKSASLFGMDVFPAASADCITITEGENDALSAHQILGSPAVSVRSSVTAFDDCKANLEYLNSFKRIYLCLDNDTPGKAAKAAVATLFNTDKVYDVKITEPFKDANDFLQAGETEAFKNVWFYSKRFIPEGIVSSFREVESILREERKRSVIEYPFETLQRFTYGLRTGEVVLVTAQEGQGKTEIIRAIEAHTLRTTDFNIGIVHLEETKQRTIQGLAGYELKAPVHLPDAPYSVEDVLGAYEALAKRDERIHTINYFEDDDPKAALDLIRFLVVKCGCKIVFLDHITMLVTGLEDDDERRRLDYISTKLAKMTKELDFCLVLISHVNDDGKTRGSRNISKIATVRIDLSRDHLAANEHERNRTYLTVSKNRFGSTTGPAGSLYFDPRTFIVADYKEPFVTGAAP